MIKRKSALEKQGLRLLRFAEKEPRYKSARLATALLDAINYRESTLAIWLLKHGADARAKDSKGRSALWWAATRCQPTVIRELVRRGAELPDDVLIGPVTEPNPEAVRFLIRSGANVNCSASVYSPLGHLHLKQVLLTAALGAAAVHHEAEIIPIMLVRAGAKVNRLVGNTWGMGAEARSMLGLAAYYGLSKTVKAMLAVGVNVDLRDNRGRTALFDAVEKGETKIVKQLLRAGAKVNAKDASGVTPLEMIREQEKSWEMRATECLLNGGSRISEKQQQAEAREWRTTRSRIIALLERAERRGRTGGPRRR